MTMQRQAVVLMGVVAPRIGLVPSTVTMTHLAFEWEYRACSRWLPVDDDDLRQGWVARLAAGRAESSTPPRVPPVGARQLPHRHVERGSS